MHSVSLRSLCENIKRLNQLEIFKKKCFQYWWTEKKCCASIKWKQRLLSRLHNSCGCVRRRRRATTEHGEFKLRVKQRFRGVWTIFRWADTMRFQFKAPHAHISRLSLHKFLLYHSTNVVLGQFITVCILANVET